MQSGRPPILAFKSPMISSMLASVRSKAAALLSDAIPIPTNALANYDFQLYSPMSARDDACAIFHAAVTSVQPHALIRRALAVDGTTLRLVAPDVKLAVDPFELDRNVRVFGFGKAVLGMLDAVHNVLGCTTCPIRPVTHSPCAPPPPAIMWWEAP